MKKEKQGGRRKNSGRKKLHPEEKRITISVYPQSKFVDKIGGVDKAKEVALNAIEKCGYETWND